MSDEEKVPSTATVRIDSELVRMARIVCAHRDGRNGNRLKLVDYLDQLVRGLITKDYQDLLESIASEQDQKVEPPRKRYPGK